MHLSHVVEIHTPKGFLLRGVLFGNKKAKRVVVWVHGLGGSLFGNGEIVRALAKGDTAVLVFNNRGHDTISTTRHATNKKKRIAGGAAHEVFAECVDDIQGAVDFAHSLGAKEVFLAGHSTGCQKSIYWAYKKKGKGVKGIILLAPVSDYSSEVNMSGEAKMVRAATAARALIAKGAPHALLPERVWQKPIDAQRFLSLYTPDTLEDIFPYAYPHKNPRLLRSIKLPILVLWAEADEHADRSAKDVAAWFDGHILAPHRVEIVPQADHGFHGVEGRVTHMIRVWIIRCAT